MYATTIWRHISSRTSTGVFTKIKCLNAFDLFSIIIWKANRSKSKLASRLIRKYPKLKPAQALEKAATSFTKALAAAETHEGRLLLAIGDWKFRLPMASAILTVLWPEDFTVYDYRVCEELLQGEFGNFRWLSDKAANHNLWLTLLRLSRGCKESSAERDPFTREGSIPLGEVRSESARDRY